MIANEILNLFKKYKLIEQSAVLPKELADRKYADDIDSLVEDVFFEFLEDKAILYGDSGGGWESGDLVGEYAGIISDYVDASNGKIIIENLETINPADEDGESLPEEDMTIAFKHNDKQYKWVFSMEQADTFYRDITYWAYEAFDGNILFLGEGAFCAFCVPKKFVDELNALGFQSKIDYFGVKTESSTKDVTNCYELWDNAIDVANKYAASCKFTESMIAKLLSSKELKPYRSKVYAWRNHLDSLCLTNHMPEFDEDIGSYMSDPPCIMMEEESSFSGVKNSLLVFSYYKTDYFDDSHTYEFESHSDFDKALATLIKYIKLLQSIC